jgi:SAM-dependent methyltransferase
MNLDDLKRRKSAIVSRYGEWTDHNIQLADGLYTMESRPVSPKWRRVLQAVADVAGQPLDTLRILDLACLEGQYAIEFARHGAKAVGIEGREGNIAKARFAKEALGLDNLELHQDDVRNLSVEKYGEFDVVLCLGLLYHLDAPDVFDFMARISAVCRRFTVIDTYVSLADKERYVYGGHTYWGRGYFEHESDTSRDERLKDAWASLDNPRSVWLTRPSLVNLLTHVGFTSTYECHTPAEPNKFKDRLTLVGIKGQPQRLLNVPAAGAASSDWPERPSTEAHVINQPFSDFSGRLTRAIPRRVRQPAKRMLRRLGLRRG